MPCGCVLTVLGHFPNKPWVRVDSWASTCATSTTCTLAPDIYGLKGWINEVTLVRLTQEEFMEAWLAAEKTSSVSGQDVVRISRVSGVRDTGWYELLAQVGSQVDGRPR